MLNIFGIVKLNLSNGMIYIYHSLGKKMQQTVNYLIEHWRCWQIFMYMKKFRTDYVRTKAEYIHTKI